MISLQEYLIQKKIDPNKFKEVESEKYEEFETLFSNVHPNSFTLQKLNLINFIRRKYPLVEPLVSNQGITENSPEAPKSAPRPVFKRKA